MAKDHKPDGAGLKEEAGTARLTADMIVRLEAENSPEVRKETANWVASSFVHSDLTDSERQLAETVFRIMLHDIDAGVRQVLAENLKDHPSLPKDIALSLARDVEEVAVPMLHYSLALSDGDLVELVRSQPEHAQVAVAGRASISEPLADILVERGTEKVVSTLVGNPGARISDATGSRILETYHDSERVMSGLACRSQLPTALAERMIAMVSQNIRDHLIELSDIPASLVDKLILQGQEVATLDLLAPSDRQATLDRLIDHLARKHRLSSTLILRALCSGDFAFFETALAKRANIARDKAQILIRDEGAGGIAALCRAAALPAAVERIVRLAVKVRLVASTKDEYENRLLDACRELNPGEPIENIDALLAKLSEALETQY